MKNKGGVGLFQILQKERLFISYNNQVFLRIISWCGQGHSEGTSSAEFEVLIINCKIVFINLFIFSCLTLNINLFISNLFDAKCLFSKNHIFCKQKRMAVYGRESLASDFKLTWENDDLLSSRHKQIFEVPHPVQEYTKMRIPDKRYRTNMVCTFWGTWSASAWRYLGLDHFSRYCTEICTVRVRLWKKVLQCAW